MELGALQCVPQNPDCEACPLKGGCAAYGAGHVQAYPVKQNKTRTRDRFFHYLYIIYKGKTWLSRRKGKDIWEGLYEFPLIETDRAMDFAELQTTDAFRRLFEGAGRMDVSADLAGRETCPVPSDPVCSFLPDRDRAGERRPESFPPCGDGRCGEICGSTPDTYLFGEIRRKLVRMIEFMFLCRLIKE